MKLNQVQLNKYIDEAWYNHAKVNQDPRAKYRFGQALWNVLPDKVTNPIYMTEKDFFHWSDERVEEILQIVYSECVG